MHSDELKNLNQLNQHAEEVELNLLRKELTEMRDQLSTQNMELQRLRQQLISPVQGVSEAAPLNVTSRRTMLRRVGGAAAGLAALSMAVGLNPVAALADEPAIDADGTGGATPSYGGRFAGNLAQIQLVPAASAGRTAGTHVAGELYADTDNNLYYYNGTAWAQLNTQTNYLPVPLRLVGPNNPVYTSLPTLAAGVPSYFPIAGFNVVNNNPSGTVNGTIPAAATGVVGTLTIVTTASSTGFATVYPANVAAPFVASIIYPPSSVLAAISTGVTVKLGTIPAGQNGAGQKGIAISANVTCQVGFDVAGYTF